MSLIRYSQWDGSQNPLGPELVADELAEHLAEDVLEGWGIDGALQRLLAEGIEGRFNGLRELAERIRRLRERKLSGRPDPLRGVKERLESIISKERAALAGDPSEEARFAEIALGALNESPASQVSELRSWEWRSADARAEFEELLEDLRRQMLDASFRNLSESLSSLSEEEAARIKDMLSDLNRLLEKAAEGVGPDPAEFDDFMAKHGELFPERPQTFDELLEVLARRSVAMSRYLASLSPEQREELTGLMNELMGDIDLAFEMSRLGQNLRSLAPGMPWDRALEMPDAGDMALGYGLDMIDHVSQLEELERSLRQGYPGAALSDIDADALEGVLGSEAAADLRHLRAIEAMLRDAGVVTRTGGRLELTPRGVRKLGERALAKVFEKVTAGEIGSHESPESGGGDEPTGSARPWQFGDSFRLDLRRTLHNAVLRHASQGRSTEGRLGIHPDDFEIAEAERRSTVATVLLLDMSRSMPLRGHWLGAKRMALALHTLISTSYPEDRLSIVGFSDYARLMTPRDLAEVDWEPVYGTNMEHAFNLAGRILAKQGEVAKQVLLVTDGEPTAHLQGSHVFFHWPPVPETLDRTYREAMRLARSGVTMNIFMLEQSPGLVGFVDRLARIVGGRVFTASGENLGDLVVSDYVRSR